MFAAILAVCVASAGVPLDDLVSERGLAVDVDPVTGIRSVGGIRFAPGLALAMVSGRPLNLGEKVTIRDGRVILPDSLARLLEAEAAPVPPPPAAEVPAKVEPAGRLKPGFKVCLDPGHGGDYDGCIAAGGKNKEKEIALALSLSLAKKLRDFGAEVVLTRSTDRHLSANYYEDLQARVDAAKSSRADLFLSLHLNWSEQKSVRGYEVYVYRGGRNKEASMDLAQKILASMRRSVDSPDRGLKESGFYVLKNSPCPGVLAELEFLSNPSGERDMMSQTHRERVVGALAEAILQYAKSRGH